MTSPRRTPDAAVLLGASAAALYALAAAPGGVWYDTQELAAAAYRVGVSHPPGQALFAVVGKLATFLPLGSVVFRTNLLSALSAGAAVGLAFVVGRLLASAVGASDRRARAAGIAAAVALGVGDALVGQATRTEVYAPAFLLFLTGITAAARWCVGPRDARLLAGAGLAAGLATTLHPPAGISVVLATAWLALMTDARAAVRLRVIAAAAAATLVGLLPLVVLFVRCRPDLPCWVISMDVPEFFRYLAGRGYSHNVQTGWAMVEASAGALRHVLARTGFLPAFALAALALHSTLRARGAAGRAAARSGAAYLGAFLLPLPLLAMMPFEEANPDVHGYLLPAFGLLLCASVALLARLRLGTRPLALVLGLVVVVPSVAATRVLDVVRTRYTLPGEFQEASLAEPPPRALLMTSSDQMYMAVLYAQQVEEDRPDVLAMAVGLCGTKRHWHDARRRRSWMSRHAVRPRGPAQTHQDAMAAGAVDRARGRAPRTAEAGHWVSGAVALGVTFDLDAMGQGEDAPLPASIVREFERNRARYADGGDRIYRRLRQRRAAGMILRGRPRAAARELSRALWELSPADREAFSSLPARVVALRPEPGLRYLHEPWVSDEHDVRTQLASVAFQAGRSDLAARALLPSFEAGNPYAVLVQADILARDGDFGEARRAYGAFISAYPEEAALGHLGLGLVATYQGRLREARRQLERAGRSQGAERYANLLGAASAHARRPTRPRPAD